jgi:holo-[acyl-carrier protein] synthase
MIIGIGTDIVSYSRINSVYQKFGEKFIARILTANEQKKILKKTETEIISFLAKRFSAKEAISKSLGVGIGKNLSFLDIEITNDKRGKPEAKVKGYENLRIHISISDEKQNYAISFALAEK